MNQILGYQFYSKNEVNISKKNNFKVIFFISFLFFIFFVIFFISIQINKIKNKKITKDLISSYEITTLYNDTSKNYISNKVSVNNSSTEGFVIGLISISKINITYPILSTTNDEFLKIAPCRFYGPLPNTVGNLCIAGHNYADNSIFGKLYLLDIGDIIDIYDLSGDNLSYVIYKKDEVEANDTSCLDQNTDDFREITLIT